MVVEKSTRRGIMSSKATIKAEIEKRVGTTSYSAWRIGLTHDLGERKSNWKDKEKKDVSCWSSWQADSLPEAHDIESYFINTKKMQGGTGGDLSSYRTVYVYIF
jgi:hypothetical protein